MASNHGFSIKAPVGATSKAVNLRADVELVQKRLNVHASHVGYPILTVNGMLSKPMIQAICKFQEKVLGMKVPDGRVDPGGSTLHKLNQPAAANHTTGPKSRVTGDLVGVRHDILVYLKAVADHYDKPIHVTSGKRDLRAQAHAMWKGWNGHIRRGRLYKYLKANDDDRQELDDLYVLAMETPGTSDAAKQKAEADFYAKVAAIGAQLSRHLTGEAVDVALTTDKKVLGALKVGLNFLEEKNKQEVVKCYHFDSTKFGKAPDPTPKQMALWPK